MSAITDLMALVEMIAEETGAPEHDCLVALMTLSRAARRRPTPTEEAATPPPAEPTIKVEKTEKMANRTRPFDSHRFREHLRSSPPGTKYTTPELLNRLHMFPLSTYAKGPSVAFNEEGWVQTGEMRAGYRVFEKPPVTDTDNMEFAGFDTGHER